MIQKREYCFWFIVFLGYSWVEQAQSDCTENEFLCQGRNSYPDECVSITFVCDGIMDCMFGQDEFNCNSCDDTNGFVCESSGDCIPAEWKCDGEWDCEEQEDELPENCPELYSSCITSSDNFICSNTNQRCLDNSLVCNHRDYDGCIDGEEEQYCPAPTLNPTRSPTPRPRRSKVKTYKWPCKSNQFECQGRGSYPSYCILSSLQCDGYSDCIFGDDERNCNNCEVINGFICEKSGECIPNNWVCDQIWDCPDQEDELAEQCGDMYSKCLNTAGSFICNNTRCIDSSLVCNGIDYDGCLNGEEELNC